MKLGHARYCISPIKKDFYLIGYKSPYRFEVADGIHDDIYCQSLLLEVEDQQTFIVSFDFLELEDEMVEEIKSLVSNTFGINQDLILLTVTHNHSSIMSYHKHWHSGEYDQEYYDFILNTVVQSYQSCLENRQKVVVKYGSENVEGFYSNRNHIGNLADNQVGVYHFINQANQCIAGIVNWAVHSTVLSAKNNMLTGELAGNVSKKLKDYWGIQPLIIVGAAADCSNRYQRKGDDFVELERVSTELAKRISTIEAKKELRIDKIEYQTLSHMVKTDIKKYHKEINNYLEKQLIEHPGIINKLKSQLGIEKYELLLQFSVIHLGQLQIITFPGELGSKFGIELKQNCLQNNSIGLISAYTNGFHYYFMPKEEYWLSFETIGNPIPEGEPEKIVEKMKQSSMLLANYYEGQY